jgi:hypothetical protein
MMHQQPTQSTSSSLGTIWIETVKKINRATIASRLQTKFALSNIDQEEFTLIDSVQPVTSVDDFIVTSVGQGTNGTAASRTDTYTVPSGKLWKVQVISGARAQAAAIIAYISTPTATQIDLTLGLATDIDFSWKGPELTLQAGWSVIVSFGSGVSGTLRSGILYEEYDTA